MESPEPLALGLRDDPGACGMQGRGGRDAGTRCAGGAARRAACQIVCSPLARASPRSAILAPTHDRCATGGTRRTPTRRLGATAGGSASRHVRRRRLGMLAHLGARRGSGLKGRVKGCRVTSSWGKAFDRTLQPHPQPPVHRGRVKAILLARASKPAFQRFPSAAPCCGLSAAAEPAVLPGLDTSQRSHPHHPAAASLQLRSLAVR
jgi:hypothetical protein